MKFQSLSDLKQILPDSKNSHHESVKNPAKQTHDGKGKSVRITLDTKGRKGKSVTLVCGLQHNPNTMEEIAKTLKQYCGAGGTVKDSKIEIQGDHRIRVMEKLRAMKYVVK